MDDLEIPFSLHMNPDTHDKEVFQACVIFISEGRCYHSWLELLMCFTQAALEINRAKQAVPAVVQPQGSG